jgi:hypothetical protein
MHVIDMGQIEGSRYTLQLGAWCETPALLMRYRVCGHPIEQASDQTLNAPPTQVAGVVITS